MSSLPSPVVRLRVLLEQRLQYARASLVFAQKATAAVRLSGLIHEDVAPAFAQASEICARLARTMTQLLRERAEEGRLLEGLSELELLTAQLHRTLDILQRYAVAGIFAAKQRDVLEAIREAQQVVAFGIDPDALADAWPPLPATTEDPLEEASRQSHRHGQRLTLPDLTEALAQAGLLHGVTPPAAPADPGRTLDGAPLTPGVIRPGMPADQITGLESEPLRYSREWFIWREAQRRLLPDPLRPTFGSR